MKIIKNILILACALTLAIPSESKASLSFNQVAALSTLGLGILSYWNSNCVESDELTKKMLIQEQKQKETKEINDQLWLEVKKGYPAGVANMIAKGANVNAQNPHDMNLTPLAAAIDFVAIQLMHDGYLLDRQLNIINILLAHGAIDYNQSAYKKALNAYNYYVKKAQNNRIYAQFASKYKAIMSSLETSTSVNYSF